MKKKTQVKKLQLTEIKPYWRNPRITDNAIESVRDSIEKFGYNVLITVDKHNVIVTGHTRFSALLALGYTEIDVIVLDLPEKKIKEYRIADNKTSELGEWDDEKLIQELREIGDLSDLQQFFPDLDLTDWVKEDVTQLEMTEKALQKAQDKLEKPPVKQEYDKVKCPECSHEFFINQ